MKIMILILRQLNFRVNQIMNLVFKNFKALTCQNFKVLMQIVNLGGIHNDLRYQYLPPGLDWCTGRDQIQTRSQIRYVEFVDLSKRAYN